MPQTKLATKFFSGTALKAIAALIMLVDHTAIALLETGVFVVPTASMDIGTAYTIDLIMRGIGRLSFPIFAFLVCEGVRHTQNIFKYLLRLAAFSIISEIPYDLLLKGKLFDFQYQNIFFTLTLSVALLALCQKYKNVWLQASFVMLFGIIARLIHADGEWLGIAVVFALYYLDFDKKQSVVIAAIVLVVMSFPFCVAALSLVFIYFYNEKRGKNIGKYSFYIFYPLHLLLLVGVRFLAFGI